MSEAIKKYLTTEEVAARFRVAKGTVNNWRNLGKGPPFSKRGARVVYPLDKLEAWEASNDNNPEK